MHAYFSVRMYICKYTLRGHSRYLAFGNICSDSFLRIYSLLISRLSSTTPSPNNTLVASSNARVHPSSSLRQKVFPPSAGATTLTSRDRKLRMKAPTVCETSSHIRNARSSTSHVHISNKEGERTIRSPSLTSTLDNDIRSDSIDGVESSTSSNHGNLVFDVDLGDCSICLESFSEDKAFICLPCNHRFHTTCLGAWLKKHSQCPNCRTNVPKVGNLVQCCIISNETIDRNKQEL